MIGASLEIMVAPEAEVAEDRGDSMEMVRMFCRTDWEERTDVGFDRTDDR